MSFDSRSRFARGNAAYAAIAAALLLYYGFGLPMKGISDSAMYNLSVDVATWTMKIGGIGMALVVLGSLIGRPEALLADAVLSGLIGLSFVLTGVVRFVWGNTQGLLFLIFGLMFVSAARTCWRVYRGTVYDDFGFRSQAAPPPDARPVHPASIHPEVLPKDGEPPPPEGYLAALAREKKEPGKAEYE